MGKLDLILENIRDEYMINLLEEGEVSELESLKTKKFLNKSLGRIRSMLVEEGALDAVKGHLANNWGKYLGGAALGAGAYGYDQLDDGEKDKISDIFNNIKDSFGRTEDNPMPIPQVAPENISIEKEVPKVSPDNLKEYSTKEAELLNYLKRELPNESFNDVKSEIEKHMELPLIGELPTITQDYNQGYINSQLKDLMDDPTKMSRAELENYIDSLYSKVSGKDNEYMDYGDEDQSFLARMKDRFGKAKSEGSFDKTYMKNLDDEKKAAVERAIALRDQLIKLRS